MNKEVINEVYRYLELMGIDKKSILSEQPTNARPTALYGFIRNSLRSSFAKSKLRRATQNAPEMIEVPIPRGVDATGKALPDELVLLNPEDYDALYGPNGALRNNEVITDWADLNLSERARSALYELIKNFSDVERKSMYQLGIDDFITSSQNRQVVINGQVIPPIRDKDELIQRMADVAEQNYQGSAKQMIDANFDEYTREILGPLFQKDIQDWIEGRYVRSIGDIATSYAEATGNIFTVAGFKSWYRQKEPAWLKFYRQRYIITTVPGSNMVRLFGEYWMPESMLQRKLAARVAEIRGKVAKLAGQSRQQRGIYEDTVALWFSVNNTQNWMTESLKMEWERWVLQNKYLRPEDLDMLKKEPWFQKTIEDDIIKASSYDLNLFIQNVSGFFQLIPGVGFFIELAQNGFKSALRSVYAEWPTRVMNFIVFKTPLSFNQMVSTTARLGKGSGLLHLIFSNLFVHSVIFPGLTALAETWAQNRVVRSVNKDIENMKEWCKNLKLDDCDKLEQLEHPVPAELYDNYIENIPFLGNKWKEGLGAGFKDLALDFTYIDEAMAAGKFVLKPELFGKGVIEELDEAFNAAKLKADEDFNRELTERIPAMTSYINLNRSELWTKLKEYCEKHPDECYGTKPKPDEEEKPKPDEEEKPEPDEEEVPAKTVDGTADGFKNFADDPKNGVGDYEVLGFYSKPFIQVVLKDGRQYDWNNNKWNKVEIPQE